MEVFYAPGGGCTCCSEWVLHQELPRGPFVRCSMGASQSSLHVCALACALLQRCLSTETGIFCCEARARSAMPLSLCLWPGEDVEPHVCA